jgi:NADH dehydrogenase
MARLVTILGGAGFVGRYVARRMAQAGWRVRVATRRPNEHLNVRIYGAPGQVEPVLCNIRDAASLRAVIRGAEAVVNCVGILAEQGKNRFQAVQAEGAGLAARIAAEEGVARFVQISAIGADAGSDSAYARTKAAGEAAVLAAFPDAVILRPSVIFGAEDRFFNRFAGMARLSPVVPIAGGSTRFQPVWVDDVAAAAAKAAMGQVPGGVYELGGPEVLSFRELMERMLREIRRRRLIFVMPFWLARILATGFDLLQAVTLGLFTNGVLTRDQLKNLARDNVVAPGAKGFADLGITPTALDAILPTYLWRFRPGGQFEAIRESARGLRDHDQA